MHRNGRLRLLMSLSGFELLGDDVLGGSWIIPSSLPSSTLEETLNSLQSHYDNPAEDIDDVDPRDLLRRKRVTNTTTSSYDTAADNVNFGNDSESDDNPEGILFPPNMRSKSESLEALKQKRRKRRGEKNDDGNDDELDDEILEAHRLARQTNALAREQKIKSNLYIHASDEESDDEADKDFFAREEERRQQQDNLIREALATGILEADGKKEKIGGGGRKRKLTRHQNAQNKRPRSTPSAESEDQDELMIENRSTPLPVPGERSPTPTFFWTEEHPKSETGVVSNGVADGISDDDEDDVPISRPTRRPRLMGGFVIDSDSD